MSEFWNSPDMHGEVIRLRAEIERLNALVKDLVDRLTTAENEIVPLQAELKYIFDNGQDIGGDECAEIARRALEGQVMSKFPTVLVDEPLLCSQGGIPYNKAHLDARDAEIEWLRAENRFLFDIIKNDALLVERYNAFNERRALEEKT